MAKVFIKTFGCSHNQADSEYMAGQLDKDGYELVNSESEADLVLINTCSVKDPSEKKFFSSLKKLKKPVVVGGCIPQADKKNKQLSGYSVVGVNQLESVSEVVAQTLDGNTVQLLQIGKKPELSMPKIRRNPIIEIVPINTGCLGYCTFCKTKQARGGLSSYPIADIIKKIRNALNDGVKEIWLTSEDTGPYGLDIGTNLPELLKEILAINRDFKLRVGMMNPEYVKRYANELVEVYIDERVFKFLHVPMQSGNDRVLKLMKREYNSKEFLDAVNIVKNGVKNITLATDIICGFPTETDEEFQDTLDLLNDVGFAVVNISKFYARPDTKAAKMEQLHSSIGKKRSSELTELNKTMYDNSFWIGWTGNVLVDDKGKDGDFIGRNEYYKPVVIKSNDNLFGKSIDVKIVDCTRDYLIGEII